MNISKLLNNKFSALIFSYLFYLKSILFRKKVLKKLKNKQKTFKVYYGCGNISQNGYINVDVRYTKAIELIGDLYWCSKNLFGCCSEVYLSHVLEHYRYPGKSMSKDRGTVPHALNCIYNMLIPGGNVRIAVPDFYQLSLLYLNNKMPLYPRITGRICGEQDYTENLHKCIFDRVFLEQCLVDAGFINVRVWHPDVSDFIKDSSTDNLDGVLTSLNLIADKPTSSGMKQEI